MNVTETFKLRSQINCIHYYADVQVFCGCYKVPWSEQAIGRRICLGLQFQRETSVVRKAWLQRTKKWENTASTAGPEQREQSGGKVRLKLAHYIPSDVLPPAKLSLLYLPPKRQPDTKNYLPEPLGNIPHSEYHTDYLTYSVTLKKSWLAYTPGWGSINKLFSIRPSSLLDLT